MPRSSEPRQVLFVQATEPGAYPPLINAAHVMAAAGWEVVFLAAPLKGKQLKVTPAPRITVINVRERPSHVMTANAYFDYCRRAITLARRIKPELVYASDPIGALPGLLAAKSSGARLIYHEHDSPTTESDLNPVVRWARRLASRWAELVIFPNEERGRLAQISLGFAKDKLQIVWNVPRRAEIPEIPARKDLPFILYFHGSITPDRLPSTIMEAVSHFKGTVRLDIAGYEAPGAYGYVQSLLDRWNTDEVKLVRYLGQIPYHADLLQQAARSHLGLALMPMDTEDVNMRHMAGASNKPFDYMAAGLPLIVSDLPEWRKMFVDAGFGRACDPKSAQSLQLTVQSFLADKRNLDLMQRRCQTMIEETWNYESQFDCVMKALEQPAS